MSASVHPRVRGEHIQNRPKDDANFGSSPRARGTRRTPGYGRHDFRFIPACAGNTRYRAASPSPRSVHPRVRGEHRLSRLLAWFFPGSSPRARGTHDRVGEGEHQLRFIPACAGNTRASSRPRCRAPVHPRVRGEHGVCDCRGLVDLGSSPRARGTLHRPRCQCGCRRFIPACAGNTDVTPQPERPKPVHPRVRGEHPSASVSKSRMTGSSPRARGTRLLKRGNSNHARFIPACAGNTLPHPLSVGFAAVHPRVRGEHFCLAYRIEPGSGSSPRARGTLSAALPGGFDQRFIPACAGNTRPRSAGCGTTTGSSPRARGTLDSDRALVNRLRFIPACAGNTTDPPPPTPSGSVHPRVRGEHLLALCAVSVLAGSSPRARGTHPRELDLRLCPRFIPACAGNTKASHPHATHSAVHPRVRGEHAETETEREPQIGSSPRARGTPPFRAAHRNDDRFIPACAGNTPHSAHPRAIIAVHPRVRGEHVHARIDLFDGFGSSPRARGTPSRFAHDGEINRFIPACAGNTRNSPVPPMRNTVHPRVRGEHLAVRANGMDWFRFIPACAGNTTKNTPALWMNTVHPRVRGEHPKPKS